MNRNIGNEDFDPHKDEVLNFAGQPIDYDPFGSDHSVIKQNRHVEKPRPITDYPFNAQKLAHNALYVLQVSKLSAPEGYTDPHAQKRNRNELRKPQ